MPYKEFCVFFLGKLFYKSNRKLFSCVCKPSTSSRICITVSNSPNPSRVYIRLCKHGKRFLLLKCCTALESQVVDCSWLRRLNLSRWSYHSCTCTIFEKETSYIKFPKIFWSLIFHISLLLLKDIIIHSKYFPNSD